MATVTGKQIADTALEAYKCDGGYIWGKTGQTWTAARQEALEKAYKADPEKNASYKLSAQYGSKWIGHRVWDCAGLDYWAAKEHGISIHLGCNLIWRCDLSHKGALTDDMDLPVGALVFTGQAENDHPHTGVYTGNGIVTEANGTIKGVIQSSLHGGKWKWWGLIKGVTYDFIHGKGTAQEPATSSGTTKLPTLRNGSKGTYVKKAQQLLKDRGYDLGICGVDGDFGPATEKAVKQFQKDWGLQQDGVIGSLTWEKLESTPVKEKTYTVTISKLSKAAADELKKKYPDAKVTEV